MTENDEAGPIVVRSISVAEIMAEDGNIYLTIALHGDPTLAQQLGMLGAAIEGVKQDLQESWYPAFGEGDD